MSASLLIRSSEWQVPHSSLVVLLSPNESLKQKHLPPSDVSSSTRCVFVWGERKRKRKEKEKERKKKKTQKTLSHLFIFYPIYLSKLHYTMLNKDTIFLHNFLQNPWLITAPSLTNTRTIIFFFFLVIIFL